MFLDHIIKSTVMVATWLYICWHLGPQHIIIGGGGLLSLTFKAVHTRTFKGF